MLKGPGRSGTEQNHIEAEFAMKGTHPPQAGLSFHGYFKIVGPAGEFRFVLPVSGLLEQIFAPATAGLGIEWPFSSVCPKKSDFFGIFFRKSSLMPNPWKSDG